MIFALILACAQDAGSSDSGEPSEAPSARTEYYIGASQGYQADGSEDGEPDEVLIQRHLDPDASQIVEDIYQVHADGSVDSFHLPLTVEGDNFTGSFTDDFGTLEVEGALVGDVWAWMIWSSVSTYIDGPYAGMYITSEDELHQRGLATEKNVYLADGELVYSILEAASPVEEAEFQARLEALGI